MNFLKGPALVAGISLIAIAAVACGGQSAPAPAAAPALPVQAATATQVLPTATSIPPTTATAPPTLTSVPTSTPEIAATSTPTAVPPTAVPPTVAPPTAVPPTAAPTPEPRMQEVATDIIGFVLEDLQVQVGTTITWTNRDAAPHTTSAGKPPNRTTDFWRSGNLGQGDSYSFTFNVAGEFAYFCEIHPGMTATITVSEGG